MPIRTSIIFLFILGLNSASAQYFPALQSDNYSGTYGVDFQPAQMADNPLKLSFRLGALHVSHQGQLNNLVQEPVQRMFGFHPAQFERRYQDNEYRKAGLYHFAISQEVLGPALSLSLKNGWGAGLNYRLRSFHELGNLNSDLMARFVGDSAGMATAEIQEQSQLRLRSLSYAEVGLGFGGVLWDNGTHFLKFGVRYKALMGNAALRLDADLDYQMRSDSLLIHDAEANYAHSERYYHNDEPAFLTQGFSQGWGLDLGFVYEYRPHAARHTYGLWEKTKWREDENKYLLRVGFSILDLGKIRFAQAANSRSFGAPVSSPVRVDSILGSSFMAMDSFLVNQFASETAASRMIYRLPTYFHTQVDVRLSQNLFVGANVLLSASQLSNRESESVSDLRLPSRFSLVPRYESRFLTFGIPFSLLQTRHHSLAQAGLSLRLGYFTFSSNNLLSAIAQGKPSHADVLVGVQVNVKRRRP